MKRPWLIAGIGCVVFLIIIGCVGVGVFFVFGYEVFDSFGSDYLYDGNDDYYYDNNDYYNDYYDEDDDYVNDDDAAAPQTEEPSSVSPPSGMEVGDAFAFTECPFTPFSDRTTCGYLTVPADHNNPGAGELQLAVAIIASEGTNPGNPPLIYLEGGPGGSAVYGGESLWLDTPLSANRDIILIDQRGTGYSTPSLNCIEYDQEKYYDATQAELDEACSDRLRNQGIDLSLFNSAQSAADIALLRLSLGYPEVDLIGISYGTRLALTVMRDHPEGIRSVILDSVYPPEADAYNEQPLITMQGLELLARDCRADAACNQAYPDLMGMLETIVADLNNSPASVEFYDYDYDEYYTEDVWGDDVVGTISNSMYDSNVIPYLPAYIGAIYDGQYDYAYEVLDMPYEDYTGSAYDYEEEVDLSDSEGMFYAVECFEEAVFTDLNSAEDLVSGYSFTFTEGLIWGTEDFLASCDYWADEQAGQIEDQPVVSSIPTLVLNGEYDPVTPPSWAEAAANSLSGSQLFIFPGYGHAVIDAGPCPVTLMMDFLADPTQPVDAACVAEVGAPDFGVRP